MRQERLDKILPHIGGSALTDPVFGAQRWGGGHKEKGKEIKSVRAGKETVIKVRQLRLASCPFPGRVVRVSIKNVTIKLPWVLKKDKMN